MHLSRCPSDLGCGPKCLVVRLASAGCKNNLAEIIRSDRLDDLISCIFQNFFGALADFIQTRRIPVGISHTVCHGIDCRVAHFRGCSIVRINHMYSPFVLQ